MKEGRYGESGVCDDLLRRLPRCRSPNLQACDLRPFQGAFSLFPFAIYLPSNPAGVLIGEGFAGGALLPTTGSNDASAFCAHRSQGCLSALVAAASLSTGAGRPVSPITADYTFRRLPSWPRRRREGWSDHSRSHCMPSHAGLLASAQTLFAWVSSLRENRRRPGARYAGRLRGPFSEPADPEKYRRSSGVEG